MTTPPSPPAGWYPDPSGAPQQRYWDGTQWAPVQPAVAEHKGDSARTRGILVVVGIVVIGSFWIIGQSNDKKSEESTTAATTTTAAWTPTTTTTTPPPGSVAPEGVAFHTEPGSSGEVVFAEFDITDALFMGLTKSVARTMTKNILQYADNKYPAASQVVVQGRFPTKDAYGNSENSIVLNVFYTRATLDKINWAGMYGDGIWEIRDGGFIHPELL